VLEAAGVLAVGAGEPLCSQPARPIVDSNADVNKNRVREAVPSMRNPPSFVVVLADALTLSRHAPARKGSRLVVIGLGGWHTSP
jgi:hypothetical protein